MLLSGVAPAACGPSCSVVQATSTRFQQLPTPWPCVWKHGRSMHAVAGAAAASAAAAARRQQRCHRLPIRTAAAATHDSEAASMADEEEWVEVGRVGPPHGVRGEFKVQPLTDFPEERLGTPGPR